MAESTAALQSMTGAKRKRVLYAFDLPKGYGDEWVKESFSLIKLNSDDELQAAKKADGNSFKLGLELAKASLVQVDGRDLNRAEGEDDTVWREMDPKLRQVIMGCYAEIHTADDDVVKKIVAGMRTVVR